LFLDAVSADFRDILTGAEPQKVRQRSMKKKQNDQN